MGSVQAIGDLRLGDRVIVKRAQGSKKGTLRYLGPTEFKEGQWAGVELDGPLGKNDGTVDGKRYFDCQDMHGLLAPISKVSPSPANRLMRLVPGSAVNASTTSSVSNRKRQGARLFGGIPGRAWAALMAMTRWNSRIILKKRSNRPLIGEARRAIDLQKELREKEKHIEELKKELEVVRREAENREFSLKQKLKQKQTQIEKQKRQLREAEAARAEQSELIQFLEQELASIRGDRAEDVSGIGEETNKELNESEGFLPGIKTEKMTTQYNDEQDLVKGLGIDDKGPLKVDDVDCTKDNAIGQLKDTVATLPITLESEQHKRQTVEEQVGKDLGSARCSLLTHDKGAGQHESSEPSAKSESLEDQSVKMREQLISSNGSNDRLELQNLSQEL